MADYPNHLIRTFDDILEKLGASGNRFERWCSDISGFLQSDTHAQYQEGLERLGQALGYSATRPKQQSAPDCRWRGVFGNTREVITFEAKIQDKDSREVSASDVGQAHNHVSSALTEYGNQGYSVRGTVVTHLTSLTPDAQASAGAIKVLSKATVDDLWRHLRVLLDLYRDRWSLYDIPTRMAAAQAITSRIPPTGWLVRALDNPERFITPETLMREWS